jgi:hypothetical protein
MRSVVLWYRVAMVALTVGVLGISARQVTASVSQCIPPGQIEAYCPNREACQTEFCDVFWPGGIASCFPEEDGPCCECQLR